MISGLNESSESSDCEVIYRHLVLFIHFSVVVVFPHLTLKASLHLTCQDFLHIQEGLGQGLSQCIGVCLWGVVEGRDAYNQLVFSGVVAQAVAVWDHRDKAQESLKLAGNLWKTEYIRLLDL